ncbi:MAG: hypothetical protein ACYCZY_03625, partial [Lacisediminihabitans sp.]
GVDTGKGRWTLTWLEGRPVVELDDGTVIRYDPQADSAVTSQMSQMNQTQSSTDEDWPDV